VVARIFIGLPMLVLLSSLSQPPQPPSVTLVSRTAL
jgi:hypothetical protein